MPDAHQHASIKMPTTADEYLALLELLMPARAAAVRFYAECAKRVPEPGPIAEHLSPDELKALFEETGFDENRRWLYKWYCEHDAELLVAHSNLMDERFGPPSRLI